MKKIIAACVCALMACSGASKPDPAPNPPPAPAPAPAPAPPPASAPKLGGACGDNCVAPAECVHYAGIAGPKVPLSSCEIKCADNASVCPTGTTCRMIADGPGHVCR